MEKSWLRKLCSQRTLLPMVKERVQEIKLPFNIEIPAQPHIPEPIHVPIEEAEELKTTISRLKKAQPGHSRKE